MQDHSFSFVVDATPREICALCNPVLRALLERRVHRFISKDNDRFMKSAIEKGIRAMRAA